MTDTKPQFEDTFADVVVELARLRDELHLKVHLAGMEVRTAWEALQPRLHELERSLEEHGTAASRALREMAETLHERLLELRDTIERDADEDLS